MNSLSLYEMIYLFLSSGFAYFTKGITGFGNTLVLASLFSFIVPNRLTTPVDLFLSIPTNSLLVWKNRKSLSLKLAAPLAITALLGAIPGTLLLKAGEDRFLKSILALVIIGIAMEMLFRKPATNENKVKNPVLFLATGVISGVLAGLYGISALIVSSISRNTHNREAFRANLCLVFLVDNLFRLVVYIATGIINADVIRLSLYIAPAVILGLLAGIKVDKRLKESTVKIAIICLLLISGAALFLRNIL